MHEFEAALAAAARDMGGRGIGTLGEKTLHLALKYYFAPDAETHEKKIGGFVADAVTEQGVFEIQTHGLSRLKPKLDAILPLCPVTVVHPVAVEKWLCKVDAAGELLSRRKSPKHESVYTAMREIYTLRDYLQHPNLRLCICDVTLTEYVVMHGRKREKHDRVPLTLGTVRMLESSSDFAALLPESLETFTVQELCTALRVPEMQARMLISLLVRMGEAVECGKKGKQKVWGRCVSANIRG